MGHGEAKEQSLQGGWGRTTYDSTMSHTTCPSKASQDIWSDLHLHHSPTLTLQNLEVSLGKGTDQVDFYSPVDWWLHIEIKFSVKLQ